MLSKLDPQVLTDLRSFLKELNKREVLKQSRALTSYREPHPALQADVIYWHPNRTKHDEVDWLMRNIFIDGVSLTNKVLNSMTVKFYGPSQAILNAIGETEHAPGRMIDYDRLTGTDGPEYLKVLDANLLAAREAKAEQWGKTELRTSLQTEAGRFAQHKRWSNMIEWIASFKQDGLIDFYASGPTFKQAFDRLTTYRGIGNYYGYHANANLARAFDISFSENEDFVVAGPGAVATLERLYPGYKKAKVDPQDILLYLRDNQDSLFQLDATDHAALTQTLKPGQVVNRLTSFGCEISCCQFNVFTRFVQNPHLIEGRKLELNKSKRATPEQAAKRASLLEF